MWNEGKRDISAGKNLINDAKADFNTGKWGGAVRDFKQGERDIN